MEPMKPERFWSIIDNTLAHLDDPPAQCEALAGALKKLSTADIEAFELRFGELMQEAYTWDLWAAAYILHGGCEEDGFDAFRQWLISRGQDYFETMSDNPETLARGTLPTVEDVCQFEDFSHVASRVWHEKKGLDPDEASPDFPMTGTSIDQPEGEPFEEDEDHLSERLPRLWKRYGENPLG